MSQDPLIAEIDALFKERWRWSGPSAIWDVLEDCRERIAADRERIRKLRVALMQFDDEDGIVDRVLDETREGANP